MAHRPSRPSRPLVVAIDPTNPNLVVASWNDSCDADLGGGWMGLAYSTNQGET